MLFSVKDSCSESLFEPLVPHNKEEKTSYRLIMKAGCTLEFFHRSNNRRSHPLLPWPRPHKLDPGPGYVHSKT